MTKAYRHGEICFEIIDKLPEGLTKSKSKVLLSGSHGNAHTFNNGEFYEKVENEFVFGYFVAKKTTLFHPEHGEGKDKTAKLPNGIYRLRRGVEYINGELKQVVD